LVVLVKLNQSITELSVNRKVPHQYKMQELEGKTIKKKDKTYKEKRINTSIKLKHTSMTSC